MLGVIIGGTVGFMYEFDNIKTTYFPLFLVWSEFIYDSVMNVALVECSFNSATTATRLPAPRTALPRPFTSTSRKRLSTPSHLDYPTTPPDFAGDEAGSRISASGECWVIFFGEELEEREKSCNFAVEKTDCSFAIIIKLYKQLIFRMV